MIVFFLILGAALAFGLIGLNLNDPQIPTPQDEQTRLESPGTQNASWNSPPFDLGQGVSPTNSGGFSANMGGMPCACVSNESVFPGTNGITQKLQQSADGSTWTDAGGASTLVGTGMHSCTALVSKRWIRRVVTISGAATNTIGGTNTLTSESWFNRNVGF